MHVCAQFVLLVRELKVGRLVGDVLAAQIGPPPPPGTYSSHNWAGFLCLIYIYIVYYASGQHPASLFTFKSHLLLLTSGIRHIPLSYEAGRKWEIGIRYHFRQY